MALSQAHEQVEQRDERQQSQSLMVRDLQGEIIRLQQARDRNISGSIDLTGPPYFVPMALGAAYFRNGQFPDAERRVQGGDRREREVRGDPQQPRGALPETGRFDDADNEVRAAEKSGFRVNENLKGDIRKKKAGG